MAKKHRWVSNQCIKCGLLREKKTRKLLMAKIKVEIEICIDGWEVKWLTDFDNNAKELNSEITDALYTNVGIDKKDIKVLKIELEP